MSLPPEICTFQGVCTGIHVVLEELIPADDAVFVVGDVRRVQNYDELTEGMNTLPTIQVYCERWETSIDSDTDRYTFVDATTSVPRRQTEALIRIDLYYRQRSQLDEDWGGALITADAIQSKLEEQGLCPLFDVEGVRSIHWTCERVLFEYTSSTLYTGYRFELTARIF